MGTATSNGSTTASHLLSYNRPGADEVGVLVGAFVGVESLVPVGALGDGMVEWEQMSPTFLVLLPG